MRKKAILVSESGLFLTLGSGTSSDQNENLRPLLNRNIPPISGKYGLRNHFWPLESSFLMRKNEKKSIFSKSAHFPILSFWILNLHIIICQFQKRSTVKHFFSLSPCSCHMCDVTLLWHPPLITVPIWGDLPTTSTSLVWTLNGTLYLLILQIFTNKYPNVKQLSGRSTSATPTSDGIVLDGLLWNDEVVSGIKS